MNLTPVPLHQELKGRLRNIGKLNHWLMAVAEAITNGLHAVEDSGRSGSVEVTFQRVDQPSSNGHAAHQSSLKLQSDTGENARSPVENVFVVDDGIGFDEINFGSFCKSDSLLKVSRGGKGVGRFHYLQAFQEAHVISTFTEADAWRRREFVFQSEDPALQAAAIGGGDTPGHKTEVQLIGLRSEYVDSARGNLREFADWLAEHFLAALIVKPAWLKSLYIRDAIDGFELTEVVSGKAVWSVDFDIRNYRFHATCYAVREGVRSDQVRLVAAGRVVDANTRSLEHYIPHLSAISDETPHVVLVASPFFDEHVNDSRNGISFSEAPDPLLGITFTEFTDALAASVKPNLSARVEESSAELRERVAKVVKTEAPQYKPLLLTYFESKDFANIPRSARAEEILTSLDSYKRRQAANLRQESAKIAKLGVEAADYEQRASKLVEGIELQKKVTLAEYVALRKIILERLEHLLGTTSDGKTTRERAIHDLIFPTRIDTHSAPAVDHQLWIIDERLESHQYLASDQPLEGRKGDRPDLLIALDHPSAFASDRTAQTSGYDRLVLVEFKRALKDLTTIPLDELPHRQMMKYAAEILEERATYGKTGRPIKTSSDVRFYLYAICEVSSAFLKRLRRDDPFILSPAGDGAFAVMNDGRYYIEYIGFEKLLEDAKARNLAFFQRLGLES